MQGTSSPKTRRLLVGSIAALIFLGVYNGLVTGPVASALSKDARNEGLTLVGYRALGLHPTEITLDLWSLENKAPLDMFRALFQAAGALRGSHFSRVNLARSGHVVFVLSGDDFTEIGQAYEAGENPVYLTRTLPEKLRTKDGVPAFETWTGGILGVLTQQLQDSNAFAQAWVDGAPPQRSAAYP